jgi:ABC-type transport system involved in Fe-S cluster assembly fused permease/ATPase subunit
MFNKIFFFYSKKNSYLKNHLNNISNLFSYFWKEDVNARSKYIIFFSVTFVMMLLNITFPLILKEIVTLLSLDASKFSTKVVLYVFLYVFVWLAAQFFSIIRELILLTAIEKVVNFLCAKVLNHIHKLPYSFHVNKKIGEVISYIDKTYQALPNIFWGLLLNIVPTIIEIIIATFVIWYLYGYLFGIILILTLMFFIIFSIIFSESISDAQSISNKKHFIANSFIVDSLLNFSLVKYFGNYNLENDKVKNLLDKREYSAVYAQKIACYMKFGQVIIIFLCISFITYIAVKEVFLGRLYISDLILINSYILQFANPLFLFGYIFKEMRKGFTDLDSIFNLLKLNPQQNLLSQDLQEKSFNKCTIEFKNVSFSFNKNVNVLNNVSFKLKPNKVIAVVGGSGAGKSTISNLLFRFYAPSSGEILVNGNNILNLHPDVITSLISIAPQNLNVFNNTIRYNLCYGNLDITNEEINNILNVTQLSYMVNNLQLGLDTLIGENGLTLSSGEKQRIALARALLKKSPVYIFDEVTSHLDYLTEKAISHVVRNLKKNASLLIIAHRLSTIKFADNIIVLNKGCIVEEGSHKELLNSKGYYFKLWQLQKNE